MTFEIDPVKLRNASGAVIDVIELHTKHTPTALAILKSVETSLLSNFYRKL